MDSKRLLVEKFGPYEVREYEAVDEEIAFIAKNSGFLGSGIRLVCPFCQTRSEYSRDLFLANGASCRHCGAKHSIDGYSILEDSVKRKRN